MIEKCIRCNKPTPYDINFPVDRRKYYIDGSGQLCEECWNALYPTYSPTTGEKKEQGEIEKDGLERLKAAREEKPLRREDFSEAELEKLKRLAPEEYELLK